MHNDEHIVNPRWILLKDGDNVIQTQNENFSFAEIKTVLI